MCGIAGILSLEKNSDSLRRMANSMALRGPDGEGFAEIANSGLGIYAGLAHRRLSIIDLATGDQPMTAANGNILVVFNGEIFNHRRIRSDLESKGYQFKTKGSDTEVLLHLWADKGSAMLSELDGMFAFSILDIEKRMLFCARDRMGIKPFYYSAKHGDFRFASTAKALVSSGIPGELDPESLQHFFSFQCSPAPNSIFAKIKKLPAGHQLTLDLRNWEARIEPYWQLPLSSSKPTPPLEELLRQVQDAVKRWSLSDVPIATSLSGGLDSSIVTASLALSGGPPVHSYTLRATDAKGAEDESELAKRLANRYSLRHSIVNIGPADVLSSLGPMMKSLDEPYAGGLPSWFIYEAMHRDGFKVCLTGVGGDELFGNYGKFLPYEKFSPMPFYKLMRMHRRNPRHMLRIASDFSTGGRYPLYLRESDKLSVLSDEIRAAHRRTSEELLSELWNSHRGIHPRNRVAGIDFQIQLPEEFLFVCDRFSMAHSVEARTPFLDHRLVETIFSLPPMVRSQTLDFKQTLKKIAAPMLPAEIIQGGKRGFTLPIERWLKNDLKGLMLSLTDPAHLKQQGIFRPDIQRTLLSWLDTGDITAAYKAWTIVMFQLWHAEMESGQ